MVNIIYPDTNMFSNQYFLLFIIILVLLQLRERRIRPWSLMIMPTFLFIITIILVQGVILSSLTNFFLIVFGFIIGLLIGYVVGSFIAVKVDEKDGRMILKGSYIAVGIWIFVIIAKVYGEGILGNSQYIDFGVLSSLILMLTLGAMISRRILIYKKYRNFKINRDKNIENNSV